MTALNLIRVAAISPHPDDLALSVGGLLATLHQRNPAATSQWIAINIFTQSLYSPYLPHISSRQEITALRRQEDQKFLSRFSIKSVDLGLEDSSCIGLTDDEESTAALISDPRREAVARSIHQALDDLSPQLLLMPTTIGNHIDHRLALAALQEWRGQPHSTVLYEDLPYAAAFPLAAVEDQVIAAHGPAEAWCLDISAVWDEKLAGLACYPSQLSRWEIASVTEHAERLMPGGKHERLWLPPTPAPSLAQQFLRDLGALPASR